MSFCAKKKTYACISGTCARSWFWCLTWTSSRRWTKSTKKSCENISERNLFRLEPPSRQGEFPETRGQFLLFVLLLLLLLMLLLLLLMLFKLWKLKCCCWCFCVIIVVVVIFEVSSAVDIGFLLSLILFCFWLACCCWYCYGAIVVVIAFCSFCWLDSNCH